MVIETFFSFSFIRNNAKGIKVEDLITKEFITLTMLKLFIFEFSTFFDACRDFSAYGIILMYRLLCTE